MAAADHVRLNAVAVVPAVGDAIMGIDTDPVKAEPLLLYE
jgi:hypothetical protein